MIHQQGQNYLNYPHPQQKHNEPNFDSNTFWQKYMYSKSQECSTN